MGTQTGGLARKTSEWGFTSRVEVSQGRKKQKSLAGKDVCSGHGAEGSVVSRGHCNDAGRAVEKCRPDEEGT